ncbi:MAG TPA: cytochrome ubiquinol oxidase subunit I [Candidatus Sulfotelmatobacter sp.]|nr:cytochrome ubiquinol oxidase subunit I [Candidatus Sulfotelmatobacter sp.]
METALAADRIQFAFTIMFHYLFPIGTMGLAPFVAWYTLRALRTGDAAYQRAARFWARIFAVNFAVGVVTGIPMEFQFGTNWALFSARTGAVIGQPLAMEGIFAFFLESVFLGVFLYGRGISPRLHAASAILVWLGSWLSGFFIVVTDAWMQHPVGYAVAGGGQVVLTNLGAVLLSPFAWWQFAHVLTGAVLTGGFVMAGVGAYYLLARRQEPHGQLFLRTGIVVAFAFSVLAVFPTGDRNGSDISVYQPAKLAAMEGLFQSETGAPLAIIGMPDTDKGTLIDPVTVPDLLSFLAYGNFRANVRGIATYPPDERPPVAVTYYAYHVMVGLGTIFLGLTTLAIVLWRLRLLERSRWLLWLLMLAMPFPYIANEAGWVTTEVGRQPWIVYGVMRTSEGASANVAGGETIFTIAGFVGMYFLLGLLFMLLVLHEIGVGPDEQHTPALSAQGVP